MQHYTMGEIVAAMTFLYLVICIIAPIYWRKGKRIWVYIVLGLGLITPCRSAVFSLL